MSGEKSNLIPRLPSDLLSEWAFQAPADEVCGRVGFSGGLLVCFPQALEGCSLLSTSCAPVPMVAAACTAWGLPAQKETCKI